MKALYKYIVE